MFSPPENKPIDRNPVTSGQGEAERMIRRLCLCLVVSVGVSACGDDKAAYEAAYEAADEAADEVTYDEAYTKGYNDGQYEVCRELEGMSPSITNLLRHCREY
jgi:hypothetical protein